MNNISTEYSNVIPFKFDKQEVRTLLIDDQPWFVAADVCASLAIGNVSLAVNGRADREKDGLDEDEKGIATVNTPSGAQEMLIVNESGLYALIFKSRKAEAKRFKKWVTAEVLPAIRKHGRYEDGKSRLATLIGQTIGTDGFHMLGAVVKGKVASLPKALQRRATSKIWSQTHAAFGVRSAEDIPADQLDSARNFIAAYVVLEGEYIQAQLKDGVTLNQHETHHLYLLMSRYFSMHKSKNEMLSAARALGSEVLMSFFDQLHDGYGSFATLDKRRDEIYGAYTATGCEGGYAWQRGAA